MIPTKYRYPTSPKNVNEDLLKPTPEFRAEALGVVGSIITFILIYLLLIVAGIVLAFVCAYAGYWIITTIRNLWVILIGIGFAGVGVMVIYFLFKFVFKSSRVDRSHMIEITAKDQPMLFDFIRQLARETQTPRPKRVYISPEVNASVFYDSGFWSMFFPIRKNLNIGLGLVNSVNVSELKAVIGHEFGHFSQKSMRLGSYTYHVNHIIHDMLYDNRDYEETLESWGNVSNVFLFFATLTGVVVEIIKEILQKLYKRINERYMALSRQMEFHADAVAASVSGSAPLATALYRFDIADSCYKSVLNSYDAWVKENKKAQNLYEHHALLMQDYAEQNGLKMENNHIRINSEVYKKLRKNRILIKDQWASHPDTVERERKLNELNFTAEIITDSAWTLFTDPEKLQRAVTENLYANVKFQPDIQVIDKIAFQSLIEQHTKEFSLNKVYKGFYDGRDITVFDPVSLSQKENAKAENISDILNENVLGLSSHIEGLTIDIEVLQRIQDKSSNVKTFDFDGTKYDRKDAAELVKKLREELKQASAELEKTDKEIFLLYHAIVTRHGNDDACRGYSDMFATQQKTNEDLKSAMSMIREASQLFNNPNLNQGKWIAITNNMVRDGSKIKQDMADLLSSETYSGFCSEEEKEILQSFINDKRKYFYNVGCDEDAINLYMQAVHTYSNIISMKNFQYKKHVLEAQAKALLLIK